MTIWEFAFMTCTRNSKRVEFIAAYFSMENANT